MQPVAILCIALACRREPGPAPDVGARPDSGGPTATGGTGAPTPPGPTAGGSGGPAGDTAATGDTGPPPAPPRLFAYVGGDDDRIRAYTVDPATGALTEVASVEGGANPSFLAFSPDRRLLYAVNEGSGELAAFAIDGATGAPSFLNRVSSEGRGPAHLAVDATGSWVLAANYGEGNVAVVAIEVDGRLGATAAERATGENAHQIVLDPTNGFAFVPNLGSDTVSQLRFDPATGGLAPNAPDAVATAPGAGPRHLAFHPTLPVAYLIAELDDTMTALAFDAATGLLAPFQTLSTLPAGVDGDDNACAEVAVHPSGRWVYGSNRGHDSIVVYEVDSTTGALALVGHHPTEGSWPRHFSLSPAGDLLFVANQRSNEVVAFRVDLATGALAPLATTPVPAGPAFVGVIDLPP